MPDSAACAGDHPGTRLYAVAFRSLAGTGYPGFPGIGRKLIDSLRYPTVVGDRSALIFEVSPGGIREAIARALLNEDSALAETRWSDAFSSGGRLASWGGVRFGSRLVESHVARVRIRSIPGVRTDSAHRRTLRLVLRRLVVADQRASGFAGRRRRTAARASRS